jgi:two-component system response regulator LytT
MQSINLKKTQSSDLKLGFDISQLKDLILPNQKNYKNRFTVKIGQHLKMIPCEEIECLYSENKATNLHTVDNRNYLIEESLEQLEALLSPEVFFRVSRKYFININAIKDIISYSNSRLKIVLNSYNEAEIIVSRERVKDFKNWLD